jgi:hypothetical protein
LRVIPAKISDEITKCTILDNSCFVAIETPKMFNYLYLKYPFVVDQFIKTYDDLFEKAEIFSM